MGALGLNTFFTSQNLLQKYHLFPTNCEVKIFKAGSFILLNTVFLLFYIVKYCFILLNTVFIVFGFILLNTVFSPFCYILFHPSIAILYELNIFFAKFPLRIGSNIPTFLLRLHAVIFQNVLLLCRMLILKHFWGPTLSPHMCSQISECFGEFSPTPCHLT